MAIVWRISRVYSDGYWVEPYGPYKHTHIGRVLSKHSFEFRAMSDIFADKFYAVVINDDGTSETVEYGSNFDLDPIGNNYAEVDDIDPKLIEKYNKVQKYLRIEREIIKEKRAAIEKAARDEAERHTPVKGKRMIVVRGRKVAKGTIGVVFFIRDGRVGLDVTGKKDSRGFAINPVWVDAAYLKAAE
jgi:hypothetical protein